MWRRRAGIVLSLLTISAIHQAANGQSRSSGRGGSRHQSGGKGEISPVTINPSPGSTKPQRPGGWCPPDQGPIVVPFPVVFGWGAWYPSFSPILSPTELTAPTSLAPYNAVPEIACPPNPIPFAARAFSNAPALPPRSKARDANRSKELIELGDRLFRAGNLIRASERYEQAIRANGDLAEPRVRLAQVALVRGKYQDAANALREAQAAEPGWLATAGDIRDLYPEPAVYNRHVATLEAHLQARPEDRDGWLVLGALWYLSGKTQQAADVFVRLTDRLEDPTLRAFLEATRAPLPAPR